MTSPRRRRKKRYRLILSQARRFLALGISPLSNPCGLTHLARCWNSRHHEIFQMELAIKRRNDTEMDKHREVN